MKLAEYLAAHPKAHADRTATPGAVHLYPNGEPTPDLYHLEDYHVGSQNGAWLFLGPGAAVLNPNPPDPRLFAGIYPCGIVYADRTRERAGDYVRLAFLDYATLNLSVESDCPADLAAIIRRDAAPIQTRKGERFEISTTGQAVILGTAIS